MGISLKQKHRNYFFHPKKHNQLELLNIYNKNQNKQKKNTKKLTTQGAYNPPFESTVPNSAQKSLRFPFLCPTSLRQRWAAPNPRCCGTPVGARLHGRLPGVGNSGCFCFFCFTNLLPQLFGKNHPGEVWVLISKEKHLRVDILLGILSILLFWRISAENWGCFFKKEGWIDIFSSCSRCPFDFKHDLRSERLDKSWRKQVGYNAMPRKMQGCEWCHDPCKFWSKPSIAKDNISTRVLMVQNSG